MREELIRVLSNKLDDISRNINALVELNEKIKNEEGKLDYANGILNLFKEENDYNILNFIKLSREDFDNVLSIVSNDADKVFQTSSCSYDGLTYLISGINNGVSLSLTEEQKSGIEYLIRGLDEKKSEYEAVIDGLLLVKMRFPVDDVELLTSEQAKYDEILRKINSETYVYETNKICEAIEFNDLNNEETVNLLKYLMEFNAMVFDNHKTGVTTIKTEDVIIAPNEIEVEEPSVEQASEEKVEENKNDTYEKFVFKPFDVTEITPHLPKEEMPLDEKEENVEEDKQEFVAPIEVEENKEDIQQIENDDYEEISFEEPREEIVEQPEEISYYNSDAYKEDVVEPSDNKEEYEKVSVPENLEIPENDYENVVQNNEEEKEQDNIDNDFKDLELSSEDYEEYSAEDEKTSNRELQRLFNEYNLKDITITSDLLNGNADNYRVILDTLRDNKILDQFVKNEELFHEVLTSSSEEEINEVLKIVKNELSVDNEDYRITLNIVINTLPSVFIRNGGNYDNFVKNVKLFKELGINLVNLFDFSKEVFIMDNELALNNYQTVKNYNIELDYRNAKYMLMLPNIAERLDYYVESIYEDKTKKEKFDGITYINSYAVKLNNVCDLTIKRLRYASENGIKVFGSKPNSLTGEITNLKVNALEISDAYLSSFFNNEFDGITKEEVREFIKLIRNSSNVGNYADELEVLDRYRKGLRYIIDDIVISYNKVVRIYNVLRSYGINAIKALQFAVCYNLVITKDEYLKLKDTIQELGGK